MILDHEACADFVELGDCEARAASNRSRTRSLRTALVAKYLLVGYVEKATGRYRDRNTATIIGEILGPVGYDDVAQRMWRHRNYTRLHGNFSGLVSFLFAMGVVIDDRIRNVTD